jgi:hypothetical protein
MEIIPTDSLRISDVPGPDASYDTIIEFARTFNGYEWAGDALKCGDLANSAREGYENSPSHQIPALTLDELRACLYFEWRRFHHFGEWPEGRDLVYIRALVKTIHDGLSAREAGGA